VIYGISGREKGLIQIFLGHGGMSRKSKAHLHNVAMITFGNSMLLMSMGARHEVRNTNGLEEGIQFFILPTTPIRLNNNDFLIKHMLDKCLELKEVFGNLKFMTKEIDPCKSTIIIDETYKIFLASKGIYCRPQTSEKTSSKGVEE
jgi:hypothetical protein